MKASKETQDKRIAAIRAAGQSIIDNAEEIAGSYDFQTGVTVTASFRPGEFCTIEVITEYIVPGKDRSVLIPQAGTVL